MYHDVSNFTRIGTILTKKDFLMVEDYDPMAPPGWIYFWQMDEKAYPGEIVFMAFNLTGRFPVRINEFALYLYSPDPPNPQTQGDVNFTIYSAAPSGTSGLGTEPDLGNQVAPWMQEYIDIPRGEERWTSFPTIMPILLDSSMTYAGTFYFAITMMTGAAMAWVCMEDVGVPPDGDGEDEGDAWYSLTWPNLDFISGPSIDFFLGTQFDRYIYPSEIGMTVNGTPVFDLWPRPGVGFWDGGWHSPAINMTNAKRYYNVTYGGPGLTYDVTWMGWFYETLFATSRFTAWAYDDWVDWNVTTVIDFPTNAIDMVISISIEDDWTVHQVLHDGLIHLSWGYRYSPTSGWWVEIYGAGDGQWTLLCESPDYMQYSEVLNQAGQVITMANASDLIRTRGYVEDDSGENATTGFGYLIVYDSNDEYNALNYSVLPVPPGGMVEINWSIWATSTYAGVYTLHILWANGTEAGLNAQTLEVYMQTILIVTYEFPPPGEPVIRGDWVQIEVYYHNQFGFPINDAVLTVYNDTSGLEWGLSLTDLNVDYEWYNWASEGFPGYYTAFLFTVNASINILHNITLTVTSPFNEGQNVTKQFLVFTRSTHIVFFYEGQPLPGLNNITDVWFTDPDPFINDTTLQFTIRYTDDFGLPITGAQLAPYIIHENRGVAKRLDWVDLSIIDPTKPGLYNITIDTNPIGAFVFHEGDPAYIIIYAAKFGYESTWSDTINVSPRPRPSYISIPAEYQQLVLYEDWTYPTSEHPVILRVILRDALNGEDLSHGTITAEVPGLGNTTLILATPGLGLYEIPALDTSNLPAGTYNVTLYAEARDFVDSIATITLVIRSKNSIGYNLELSLPDAVPNQGLEWWMNIQFYLENASSQQISTTLKSLSSHQPGMTFLPVGTKVTLSITTTSGNPPPLVGYVGDDGWISFEGLLDLEGEYNFYLTIEGAENYAAMLNMPLEYNGGPLSVNVMSFGSLLMANLPIIALIAAIIVIVPLGSVLTYRRYVLIPKRQKRLAKYQAIADTFSDVANLNRLLVLHKESGICVFDPFAEESQDATLVAGFLQAISTFGHDLADSPGLANGNKAEVTTLRELQYEGFRILIHDGKFVRNALVLSGTPSEQLRERLEAFTQAFERRYKSDFENWEGRVDQFNGASDLVEEVFLISLRHPHRVAARKPRGAHLSSLESDIFKLSKELTKDREYIFLGQILSTYLAAAKTDKLEALMAIYQLRMKKAFIPIQLAPMGLPEPSAA